MKLEKFENKLHEQVLKDSKAAISKAEFLDKIPYDSIRRAHIAYETNY